MRASAAASARLDGVVVDVGVNDGTDLTLPALRKGGGLGPRGHFQI